MDDMNSHELKPLDALNNFGLWLIWMIIGYELNALNAMNISELWMIWRTGGPVSLKP